MSRCTHCCHPEEVRAVGAKNTRATKGSAFSVALLFASLILPMIFVSLPFPAPAFAGDKAVTWKPAAQALLRVDDQPVKNWNLYQEGKKTDPLLLQMGNRFLLIEVRDHKIFELAPATVEHKGAELLWDPADRPSEPLATTDWIVKDVGFAYRTSARLVAENRVLDLQLPHPLNLKR